MDQDADLEAWLQNTVFAYGAPGGAWFGHLCLQADGSVSGYTHPNERQWRVSEEHLDFLSEEGRQTSRFRISRGGLIGRSNSGHQLVLVPLLSTGLTVTHPDRRGVLINSIPKAGTYFLEAAFVAAGWTATHLHLAPGHVDDYRGLAPDQMHREPEQVRTLLPTRMFGHLLAPGSVTVAHIPGDSVGFDPPPLPAIIVPLIRDLQHVIASFARFRRTRVRPRDRIEEALQNVPRDDAIFAFLALEAERDVAFLKEVAAGHARSPLEALRYEDATRGIVPTWLNSLLGETDDDLAETFADTLRRAVDTPTSTSSRGLDPLPWSRSAESLFRDLGLADLNSALGYGP